MPKPSLVLIYPPVVKPSEPPAGVARIVGALRRHGVDCRVFDANLGGLYHRLEHVEAPQDVWSQRARRNLERHLRALCDPLTYQHPDRYRRAVSDIGRLLALTGGGHDVRTGLADLRDRCLSPVRTDDLREAARHPERNPYCDYFKSHLLPELSRLSPAVVGISLNYLSQALCAFALIGLIRESFPNLRLVLGGGLVTSWMRRPKRLSGLSDLVDRMIPGPGELALLREMGCCPSGDRYALPDYSDLAAGHYLSPGFILPFSASDGCWWRRCAFCPERAEQRPFRPLPHSTAVRQLRKLTLQNRPVLIHLLDNALSPAMLNALAGRPPGAPWYGFVRIHRALADPGFCKKLAASGCKMLKIGLESGDPAVLDRLHKGISLRTASQALNALHQAGISTYVYLLFGTPAENALAAQRTLDFVAAHQPYIGFLNTAIFNLPVDSPEAGDLALRDFYAGDLALYRDFKHPRGWDRNQVRRFVEKTFRKHPAVQSILRRTPPVFTSNHAAFFNHF